MVSKLHVIPMITIYQRPIPSKARENKHWWIFQNKKQSKIQNSIARIMPKVGRESFHGNWSDKVEVEALLFLAAELSVVIENLKVSILYMPVCMCVCFLFFCGYSL